jgi:chromate transporter
MMKIGLFTFGGGYAMLALLENEFVNRREWLCKEEFLDMVAISESTPGPIAINSATYIGYRACGFLGSLLATVAVCIPSFVIIYAISLFFDAFLSLTLVEYAFRGIQACVVYLILSAGLKMLRNIKKTPLNIAIICTVMVLMTLFSLLSVRFSTIFYILISGGVGLCIYLVSLLKRREGGGK